ncbi:hypothetical protein QWJ41_09435 [Nocardioides sp. SOB44]|uniref:HEAT repeat domain-containing protein n=1 Tax=Nocardioides cremeus TaxID=3058044 RepID=A0ABT8TS03_9ACTN|nr:hypothetical protein [Nocardioides cremeus]MDO3395938.1 hypothetical protein [Nocardioides cremeus]
MPDDPSTMRSPSINANARTSWLLATSRSCSTDPAVASRSSFVERLREHDVNADPSRVSRWESGAHTVPAKVVLGYERAIGLPQGVLLSAQRGVLRISDPRTPAPETVQFSQDDTPADELISSLLSQAGDSAAPMTGADWLRLAVELTRFEMVLLPAETWATVCSRLINELARTTGGDRLRRYDAAITLVSHPVAQRHVVQALGAWLVDPHVQVVNPMLSLLQHVRNDGASKLVLRLLDSDNRALSQGAVQVAAAKVARGHFQGAALALLEQRAIRELVTPQGHSGIDILDLTTHLPGSSYQRVLMTLRDAQLRNRVTQARETRCLLVPETSRTMSRDIATKAQSATPKMYAAEPDLLLQRLVGEALFHVHGARRSMAVNLLRVSPYGSAVADACLTLASADSEFVGARAWETIWQLGVGSRRNEIVRLADNGRHPWMQRRALTALGNSGAPLDDAETAKVVDATLLTSHRGVCSAGLLALGMGAPSGLGMMDSLPANQRAAANWWLKVGPSIVDGD